MRVLSIHDVKVDKATVEKNLFSNYFKNSDNIEIDKSKWEYCSNLYDAI